MFGLFNKIKNGVSEISVDNFIKGVVVMTNHDPLYDVIYDSATIEVSQNAIHDKSDIIALIIEKLRKFINNPSEIIIIDTSNPAQIIDDYSTIQNNTYKFEIPFYVANAVKENSKLEYFVELKEYLMTNPETPFGKNEYLDYLNSNNKNNIPFSLWIEIMKDKYEKV